MPSAIKTTTVPYSARIESSPNSILRVSSAVMIRPIMLIAGAYQSALCLKIVALIIPATVKKKKLAKAAELYSRPRASSEGTQKRNMTSAEILKAYEEGLRNFTNLKINMLAINARSVMDKTIGGTKASSTLET